MAGLSGASGRRAAVLLGVAMAALGSVRPAPPAMVRETRLSIHVRPLALERGQTFPLPALDLEIPSGGSDRAEATLGWPGGGSGRLRLVGETGEIPAEGECRAHLSAAWSLDGRRSTRAEAEVALREGATTLFEVWSEGDRRLTLALDVERVVRSVLRPPSGALRALRFDVAIERVLNGKSVALESNALHTFVGEPVEYSFRLGPDDSREALTLRLRPVSVRGRVVDVEVEIEGSLASPDGAPLVVSRRERRLTTADTPNIVDAVSGDPPSGYRFVVTPRL